MNPSESALARKARREGTGKAVSVSDLTYPGNAHSLPRDLASPMPGVDLWWCELATDADAIAAFAHWLSAAEHARASRFGRPSLAARYIAGRANLRWILAGYVGGSPTEVPIERAANGRPHLAGIDRLDFNVSNTREVALIGVTTLAQARIGVDVEHAMRALDHAGLSRKYLTSGEQRLVSGLAEDARRRAFLRLWTCKEAMSKATGDALSAPLRRMDVTLAPALRLVDGPPPYVPAAWALADAAAPADFLATVALWQPQPAPPV